LGTEIAEATPEDNIVVIKNETLGQEVTVEIPQYPFPYFRGKNGGVYRRGIPNPETEDDAEDTLVYENDFYVVKRMYDQEQGEVLWLRLHLPKDGVREFSIPLTDATSKDRFRDTIAAQGIMALGKTIDPLMFYIQRWLKELQQYTTPHVNRICNNCAKC
jgi:hypothetical protein